MLMYYQMMPENSSYKQLLEEEEKDGVTVRFLEPS